MARTPRRSPHHYDTSVPAGPPQRAARQRSETRPGNPTARPEDAAVIADRVTPSTSERVMGLPGSPSAAETGTGY